MLLPLATGSVMMLTDIALGGDPVISVRSPAVHRRERLLNDTYEQLAWLDEQLEFTKHLRPPELGPEPGTSAVNTRSDPGADQLGANKKGDEAASSGSSAKEAPAVSIGVRTTQRIREQPSPLYSFQTIDSYRDVLRGERAISTLDDRHDIDGNELYFFTFDTSILAGPMRHGYAFVSVTISPLDPEGSVNPEQARSLKDQDYRDTYFDWMERLQTELDASIKLKEGGLVAGTSADPDARDIASPEIALQTLACLEWITKGAGIAGDIPKRQEARQACDNAFRSDFAPREFQGSGSGQYDEEAAKFRSRMAEIDDQKARELPRLLVQSFEEAARRAVALSPNSRSVKLPSYSEASNACVVQAPQQNSNAKPSGFWWPNAAPLVYLPCPMADQVPRLNFYNAVLQGIVTAKMLQNINDLQVSFEITTPQASQATWLLARSISTVVTAGDQHLRRQLDKPEGLACVAAILQYDVLNAEAGRVLPGRGERLDEWFKLTLEQASPATCRLGLHPRIDPRSPVATEYPRPQIDPTKTTLLKFTERLDRIAQNVGAFAFSYSLRPRLRQRFSLDQSSQQDIAGSGGRTAIAAALGGSFGGELSDLNVVGFEPDPPATKNLISPSANFGWLISPQRTGFLWSRELVSQQAELGAIVSVPSWWRTVSLKVCTGYSRRLDVGAIDPARLTCRRSEMLRLPGTAAEVSRRLGQQVVTFPYIEGPEALTPNLTAFRRGQLLLKGGRLWRSTVVMLGAQKADRIEVLPDMRGIIATFDCVEVPSVRVLQNGNQSAQGPAGSANGSGSDAGGGRAKAGPASADGKRAGEGQVGSQAGTSSTPPPADSPTPLQFMVPVRVWTSEGVTPPTGVLVDVQADLPKAAQCPDRAHSAEPRPEPTASPVATGSKPNAKSAMNASNPP